MKITTEHTSAFGYCCRGMRVFAARYNLDYRDFIKNGIDSEVLLSLDDALATDIVRFAEEWEARKR